MLSSRGVWAQQNQIKHLDPRSWIEPPCVIQASLAPNNVIQIGAFTGIYGGRIGHSHIGRYCSISYGVDIASDQHPIDWLSTSMIQYVEDIHGWESWLRSEMRIEPRLEPKPHFESNSPVLIGNDVWIGQGAFVKSGIKIADGAVIAAHAVVVNDVEPYAIVAGVPARTIRKRFSNQICDRLMELQWWKYCIHSIPDLDFNDIDLCIDTIFKHINDGIITPYTPSVLRPSDL